MNQRCADITAGVFSLILALIIFINSAGLSRKTAAFPVFIGGILAVSGFLILIKRILLQKENGASVFLDISFLALLCPFLLWLLLVILIEIIGFYASAPLFLFFMMSFTSGENVSLRKMAKNLFFTLCIMTVMWLVFSYYLELYLPENTF